MNWGDNLTLVGAIRREGWVVLNTKWRAMTKVAFLKWVRRQLVPRLRRGDIVLLDNLQAHKAPREPLLDRGPRGDGQTAATVLARLQSHRTHLGLGQETDP